MMLFHGLLAKRWPEFAIDEEEGKEISKAFAKYASHWEIETDPRKRDLGALIMVLAMIEGPRAMRAMARTKAQRQRPAGPPPAMPGPRFTTVGPI